jgi:hypothetical protein
MWTYIYFRRGRGKEKKWGVEWNTCLGAVLPLLPTLR